MKISQLVEKSTPMQLSEAEDFLNQKGDIIILRFVSRFYVCQDRDMIKYVFKNASNICPNCDCMYKGECQKFKKGVMRAAYSMVAAYVRHGETIFEPVFRCERFKPFHGRERSDTKRMSLLEELNKLYDLHDKVRVDSLRFNGRIV